MRRDSLTILVISVVLTAGIVGTAHYLYLQNQKAPSSPVATQSQSISDVAPTGRSTAQTPIRRTGTPIKCTQANRSVFWTNASRCKDADLNNRLSYADPVKPVPRVMVNKSHQKSSRASTANKKTVKAIPRDIKVECKFPIRMARKIEKKSLSLKNDATESIWKDSYCKWVNEARGCPGLGDYLLYENMCSYESVYYRASNITRRVVVQPDEIRSKPSKLKTNK